MTWTRFLHLLAIGTVGFVLLMIPTQDMLALSMAPQTSLANRPECREANRRSYEVKFRYEHALREFAHQRQMALERALRISNMGERRQEIQRIEDAYHRHVEGEQERFNRENADIQRQCDASGYENPPQQDFFDPPMSVDSEGEAAIDQHFRLCMLEAMDHFDGERIRIYEEYHLGIEEALRRHHQETVQAWSITDERARNEATMQADRTLNETRDVLNQRKEEAGDQDHKETRNARRICEEDRNDEEREFREEQDANERTFREEERRREEQLRQEQQRQEEERHSGNGANCQPYVCDGQIYPTCTEEGFPINYFRNPCEPLPR